MAPEVPMALKLLVRLAVGSGGAMRGCSPRLIPTTSLGLELPSPVPPWGDSVLNCRPGRAGCLHASHPMAVTGAGVRPSISHRAADTGAPQLSTTSPGSCCLRGGDVIPGFWLCSSSLSLSCMCRLAAHVLLCSSVGHWVWGSLSISLLPRRSLADPGAPWGSHLVPRSPHGAGRWGGQHAWHWGGWWHSLPWSRSQHNPAGPRSSAGCPAPGGDGSAHGRDSGGCHWGAG